MKGLIIRKTDVENCPKHSLVMEHYNYDGSCNCPEVEVVKLRARVADLEEAQEIRARKIRQLEKALADLKVYYGEDEQ